LSKAILYTIVKGLTLDHKRTHFKLQKNLHGILSVTYTAT
jgi:hypothetical protein